METIANSKSIGPSVRTTMTSSILTTSTDLACFETAHKIDVNCSTLILMIETAKQMDQISFVFETAKIILKILIPERTKETPKDMTSVIGGVILSKSETVKLISSRLPEIVHYETAKDLTFLFGEIFGPMSSSPNLSFSFDGDAVFETSIRLLSTIAASSSPQQHQ